MVGTGSLFEDKEGVRWRERDGGGGGGGHHESVSG